MEIQSAIQISNITITALHTTHIIIREQKDCFVETYLPNGVRGTMSPYPTVLIVTTAHHEL